MRLLSAADCTGVAYCLVTCMASECVNGQHMRTCALKPTTFIDVNELPRKHILGFPLVLKYGQVHTTARCMER